MGYFYLLFKAQLAIMHELAKIRGGASAELQAAMYEIGEVVERERGERDRLAGHLALHP